jgi:hypothetical protein
VEGPNLNAEEMTDALDSRPNNDYEPRRARRHGRDDRRVRRRSRRTVGRRLAITKLVARRLIVPFPRPDRSLLIAVNFQNHASFFLGLTIPEFFVVQTGSDMISFQEFN